jgi:hypothetical protein
MKKIASIIAIATLVAVGLVSTVRAGEKQEITITGEGKCAKCALHEGEKCQTVIQTQEDGKTVTYYVKENKVSKAFHEKVCQATEKVTATGTVKEHEGKKVITVSKIEVVK